MTAAGIIEQFPNKPYNVIVVNPTKALLLVAKHQQIVRELPSDILLYKYDESPLYLLIPPSYESFNLVYHQPHVKRFRQMASPELVTYEE